MSGAWRAVIIAAAIMAALVLLLSFRLKLVITYSSGETRAVFRFLFLKFPLHLSDGETKIAAKEKKKEKTTKDKAKDTRSFEQQVSGWLKTAASAGKIARLVFSLLKAEIFLRVRVSEADSAKTAVRCGEILAFSHSAAAFLANLCEVKRCDISVFPDYDGEKSVYDFKAVLFTRPIWLVLSVHKIIRALLNISSAPDTKKRNEKERKK